ncbi:MAG: sodium-dependent transporter [Victivallaceae bacterium]|nr:sodium-dependent transporter [Victivallaceae bacterium]
MKDSSNTGRESWTGQLGFILAGAGSAIGLGNVWKFPYITGMNGGGAFVLIYLICVVLVGLPLMLCEIAMGRKTHRNPFGAFRELAPGRTATTGGFGLSMFACGLALLFLGQYGMGILLLIGALSILRWGWAAVGALGVIIPVLILSYYNVIGGWLLVYLMESVRNADALSSATSSSELFGSVASNWRLTLGSTFLFSVMVLAVVWFGVRRGIERVSKVLMPLLIVMLVALILRAITLPGSGRGVSFLLTPNFGALEARGMLEALGHAFFTLSLGMGIIITYGSYVGGNRNILGASLWIILLDTTVALMAGLAIFPALFSVGMSAAGGPGLVFKIMPVTLHSFGDGLGLLWSFLFFGLVLIAALTSAISLLEVPVAFCIDQFKWPRRLAVSVVFAVVMVLSVASAVGAANWDRILWLRDTFVKLVGDAHLEGSFFDQLDVFCSSYLLPLSGFLTVIFVAYVWKTRSCLRELRRGGDNYWDTDLLVLLSGLRGDGHMQERRYTYTLGVLFGLLIRIVAPLAIIVCFMNLVGWIKLT